MKKYVLLVILVASAGSVQAAQKAARVQALQKKSLMRLANEQLAINKSLRAIEKPDKKTKMTREARSLLTARVNEIKKDKALIGKSNEKNKNRFKTVAERIEKNRLASEEWHRKFSDPLQIFERTRARTDLDDSKEFYKRAIMNQRMSNFVAYLREVPIEDAQGLIKDALDNMDPGSRKARHYREAQNILTTALKADHVSLPKLNKHVKKVLDNIIDYVRDLALKRNNE